MNNSKFFNPFTKKNTAPVIIGPDDIAPDKNGLKLRFYKLNEHEQYEVIIPGLPSGYMVEGEAKAIMDAGYEIASAELALFKIKLLFSELKDLLASYGQEYDEWFYALEEDGKPIDFVPALQGYFRALAFTRVIEYACLDDLDKLLEKHGF